MGRIFLVCLRLSCLAQHNLNVRAKMNVYSCDGCDVVYTHVRFVMAV
jgi:hypothetical protein